MAKREKEKKEKTKVEFVTGVAKKILPIDKQSLPGTGGLVSTGTGASTSTAQILGRSFWWAHLFLSFFLFFGGVSKMSYPHGIFV